MFSVYGSTGRVFRGTLDQLRQINKVHAPDRTRALEPTARDGHDSAVREAVAYGSATATPQQRSAIAAYATTQQAPVQQGWVDQSVADVMSRTVLSLPADTSIYQAWKQMQGQGRGQAPVVNDNGILVGLVTRADLVRFEQWPGPRAQQQDWDDWRDQAIESIMVTPVPSVAPQTPLRHAAGALLESGLPGLPVVDDDGHIVGFVSRADVLRAALKDAGLSVWG